MAHVQGTVFIIGASHEHHEECKPESDIPCWKAQRDTEPTVVCNYQLSRLPKIGFIH